MKVLICTLPLGGRGRTSIRGLARAWARPATRSSSSRQSPIRRTRPRRRHGAGRCSTAAPGLRADQGTWRPATSGPQPGTGHGRAERRRARALARRFSSRTTYSGAPVGAAVGMPFTVKAHGSELEFDARERGAPRLGAREPGPAAEVIAGSDIRAVLAEAGLTERVRQSRPRGCRGVPAGARDVAPPPPFRRRGATRRPGARPDAGNAKRLAEFLGGGATVVSRREAQKRRARTCSPRSPRTSTREPSSPASGRRAKSWSAPPANACLHRRPRAPPPPPSLAAR
jgi:hypothetical protein